MTRLLLDTHALLWFVANDAALSASARSLIENADEVRVSIASAWEIAIKVSLGKLALVASSPESFFEEQMRANSFEYLPITPEHVFRAAALPLHHRIGVVVSAESLIPMLAGWATGAAGCGAANVPAAEARGPVSICS